MKTAELMKSKGLKPTIHRVQVLEYLKNVKTHPTADEIYDELKKTEALISRATVYNALRKLVEHGLITRIVTPYSQRYDYIYDEHQHFYCQKCNKIFDVEVEFSLGEVKSKDIAYLNSSEVLLIGVCKQCADRESEEKN